MTDDSLRRDVDRHEIALKELNDGVHAISTSNQIIDKHLTAISINYDKLLVRFDKLMDLVKSIEAKHDYDLKRRLEVLETQIIKIGSPLDIKDHLNQYKYLYLIGGLIGTAFFGSGVPAEVWTALIQAVAHTSDVHEINVS